MTKVVDADSHLTEPADLWVENLPTKWKERAPRALIDPAIGMARWQLNGKWLGTVGTNAHAGWKEHPPSRPSTYDQMDPACFSAPERTEWLDDHGVGAQVLYPNFVAFEGHAIMALNEPEFQLAIIKVYNDYVLDFARSAPGRFIPIASLPFWDREESIKEMQRCADAGHGGVLWAATLAKHGLPGMTDTHWDPFYAAAQEAGMSINLHVGVGMTEDDLDEISGRRAAFDLHEHTGSIGLSFMSNARAITSLIVDGVCARHPSLNFVSVESGFGWIPFLLEALDWQWKVYDGPRRASNDLLPSEYFRRQIYGMFWFEQSGLRLADMYEDNVMFETDFPHTTSLSPGPGSPSQSPMEVVENARKVLSPAVFEKVMYSNAARVYHLDSK
jgi:predicted TIM-barrel fold metal-dependent hydrolase